MSKKIGEKTLRIIRVFSKIIKRLPSTYPKPILVVHSNLKRLQKYYWETSGTALDPGDPGHSPVAFCDGYDFSIHVSSSVKDKQDLYWYLLHEIGHLVALDKYGEEDYRWEDYKSAERYANSFADRWYKKFKKEGYFRKL